MVHCLEGDFGLPLVGNSLDYIKSKHDFLINRVRRHGSISKAKIFGQKCAIIAGEDLLHRVSVCFVRQYNIMIWYMIWRNCCAKYILAVISDMSMLLDDPLKSLCTYQGQMRWRSEEAINMGLIDAKTEKELILQQNLLHCHWSHRQSTSLWRIGRGLVFNSL